MTTEQRYGCHCDLEPGMEPDGCVLDCGRLQDCIFAQRITRKEECGYWLPVVPAVKDRVSELERELAASRATVGELVGALQFVKDKMPQGASDKCGCAGCELYDAIMPTVDAALAKVKP